MPTPPRRRDQGPKGRGANAGTGGRGAPPRRSSPSGGSRKTNDDRPGRSGAGDNRSRYSDDRPGRSGAGDSRSRSSDARPGRSSAGDSRSRYDDRPGGGAGAARNGSGDARPSRSAGDSRSRYGGDSPGRSTTGDGRSRYRDDRPSRGGAGGTRNRSSDDRSSRGASAGDGRSRSGDARPGRSSSAGSRGRYNDDRPSSSGGRGRPSGGGSRDGGGGGGRPPRPGDDRRAIPPPTGRGGSWGGLARRAASQGGTAAPLEPTKGRLAGAGPSRAAEAFAAARHPDDTRERPDDVEVVAIELIHQSDEAPVRDAARKAVRRGGQAAAGQGQGHAAKPGQPSQPVPEAQAPERRTRKPPAALTEELTPVVGANTAPKLAARLADAGRAFEAERFLDARRILTGLVRQAPTSVAVRELSGLTFYRLGKWREAAAELEAFRELSGSTEQNPVLADCYRALRRYDEVEELWRELREVSPSAELVAEGRIVYAGSLADRGDIDRAIAEVEPSVRRVKAPKFHHLRLLYVLGDLYERAGDAPHARLLFDRVLAVDPAFGDAAARRRAL